LIRRVKSATWTSDEPLSPSLRWYCEIVSFFASAEINGTSFQVVAIVAVVRATGFRRFKSFRKRCRVKDDVQTRFGLQKLLGDAQNFVSIGTDEAASSHTMLRK
jgi:hypothetical protein